MDILEQKAAQYVEKDLISREKADTILKIARGERGQGPEANPLGGADGEEGDATRGTRKLNLAEMATLLAKREGQMRDGGSDEHPTDQCYIPGGEFFRNPLGFPDIALLAKIETRACYGGGSIPTSCKDLRPTTAGRCG